MLPGGKAVPATCSLKGLYKKSRIGDVAGVPSMVIHLMGLIIGSVFAVVFRKSLQGFFDKEKASKNAEFVNTPQTV